LGLPQEKCRSAPRPSHTPKLPRLLKQNNLPLKAKRLQNRNLSNQLSKERGKHAVY
jgi:hypothetical protein